MAIKKIKEKALWARLLGKLASKGVSAEIIKTYIGGYKKDTEILGIYEKKEVIGVCAYAFKRNFFGQYVDIVNGPLMNWREVKIRDSVIRQLVENFKHNQMYMLKVKVPAEYRNEEVYKSLNRMGFRNSGGPDYIKEYPYKPLQYNLYRFIR